MSFALRVPVVFRNEHEFCDDCEVTHPCEFHVRPAQRQSASEYIAKTDPLLACAGLDDPAASYCGSRGCLMRERDALKVENAELKAKFKCDCGGDISYPRECNVCGNDE